MPMEARLPSRKGLASTYDPSRVKSSIPGASKPQPYKNRKVREQAASYVEELKMAETVRAVKLEEEQ